MVYSFFVVQWTYAGLYSGGEGSFEKPYIIAHAEDIVEFASTADDNEACFLQIEDVDLYGLTGISKDYFNGRYDGGGHEISNGKIILNGVDKVAFFRKVGQDTVLENIKLKGFRVKGRDMIATLVGYNYKGRIENCKIYGCDIDCKSDGGGLVGYSYYGTIVNCQVTGNISADDVSCGGLVGTCSGGDIKTSFVSAIVAGSGDTYGGLVGTAIRIDIDRCFSDSVVNCAKSRSGGIAGSTSYVILTNCYAQDKVSGSYYVGGLVGSSYYGQILNSYAANYVFGTGIIGGLVGACQYGEFTGSFWDINESGSEIGVGNYPVDPEGVQGLATFEMVEQQNYLDAGWDFEGESVNGGEDIWVFSNGYPYLAFEQESLIDLYDFSLLATYWLQADCNTIEACCHIDLVGDGEINISDLEHLLMFWLEHE